MLTCRANKTPTDLLSPHHPSPYACQSLASKLVSPSGQERAISTLSDVLTKQRATRTLISVRLPRVVFCVFRSWSSKSDFPLLWEQVPGRFSSSAQERSGLARRVHPFYDVRVWPIVATRLFAPCSAPGRAIEHIPEERCLARPQLPGRAQTSGVSRRVRQHYSGCQTSHAQPGGGDGCRRL